MSFTCILDIVLSRAFDLRKAKRNFSQMSLDAFYNMKTKRWYRILHHKVIRSKLILPTTQYIFIDSFEWECYICILLHYVEASFWTSACVSIWNIIRLGDKNLVIFKLLFLSRKMYFCRVLCHTTIYDLGTLDLVLIGPSWGSWVTYSLYKNISLITLLIWKFSFTLDSLIQ